MFEINGKVCLITGGAKGIGLSCAKELLKNGLKGVSLIDIDVENGEKAADQLRKEYGENSAIYIKTDVTNEHELEEAFEATTQKFQQLDIVINNAGIAQEIEWLKCIQVNLIATISGTFLAMQKYLPKFKGGDEGVIINIASILGFLATEEVPIYSTTKSGIIALSRSLGGPTYYDMYRVRVLTLCPGATDTSMLGLTEKTQQEPFRSKFNKNLQTMHIQGSESVSQHLIPILREGDNGTVWAVLKNARQLIQFPTVEE